MAARADPTPCPIPQYPLDLCIHHRYQCGTGAGPAATGLPRYLGTIYVHGAVVHVYRWYHWHLPLPPLLLLLLLLLLRHRP